MGPGFPPGEAVLANAVGRLNLRTVVERFAGGGPGAAGQQERVAEEGKAVAVGYARRRCFPHPGCLDEPDDVRLGPLGSPALD